MNVLLISLNAKYIHTCLAIHSLKTYADEQLRGNGNIKIETAEYTINQPLDDIYREICKKKPDLLAASCYIWNIEQTKRLVLLLHLAFPKLPIWLGGPEVSFDAAEILNENPAVTGIMTGEGEISFTALLRAYVANTDLCAFKESENKNTDDPSAGVPGIAFRKKDGTVTMHKAPPPVDLDTLPFPYPDLKTAENRIVYYESSRGCPFRCSYCLSSIEKQVRFKNLNKVFHELQIFLDQKIPLVKFVDRTFNCDHERTLAIWNFLKSQDNGITRFHFEAAADLFRKDELSLLSGLRPGLVQLEIGVQSANPETLQAIRRSQDLRRLQETTDVIKRCGNVHQHLDLIAGLPFEDMESFSRSFDTVYRMQPSQLQLGFLKLLKGSEMYQTAEAFGIQYRPWPPYEVVSTKWISTEELLFLKSVERVVETYYNSGQFASSISYLLHFVSRPWELFSQLAAWMDGKEETGRPHNRLDRYQLLRSFAMELPGVSPEALDNVLLFDLCLREKLKTRPDWAPDVHKTKKQIDSFYAQEAFREKYLPEFVSVPARLTRHETHMEIFSVDIPEAVKNGRYLKKEWIVLFNYRRRNPLDASAETTVIES